jgi:L-asparaginase II
VVESRHRGSVAVVDTDGGLVLALGDVEQAILPRSAVKALQALPLIVSGAADRFGFDARALTLACASHTGEPGHVDEVTATLTGMGLGVEDLACGAHWPTNAAAARAVDEPTAAHNNCSGKHTGFLALALGLDTPTAGYTEVGHPVQIEAHGAIESVCATPLGPPVVDGCSAPTWPIELRALAHGFARFGTGDGLSTDHAAAADRLRAAVAANPWFVRGTGGFDTEVTTLTGQQAFLKVGAEGVYAAAVPDVGLGIALKVDDGAQRAAEVTVATVLQTYLPDIDLGPFVRPPVMSWRGTVVGHVQPGPGLADLPS